MEDQFSKYFWEKLAKDKIENTILRTLDQFFTYHGYLEILQSDNENNLIIILWPNIYIANKIKIIYRNLITNKIRDQQRHLELIHNEFISAKYHHKKFDLDEGVSELWNIIIQKSIVNKAYILNIISDTNNKNLIQEAIDNINKKKNI